MTDYPQDDLSILEEEVKLIKEMTKAQKKEERRQLISIRFASKNCL